MSYTLAFYPDNAKRDGAFHPVRVAAPGHPELKLRYRSGYFDGVPVTKEDPGRRRFEMKRLVWSPLDAAGIALTADVESSPADGGRVVNVRIGLDTVGLQTDGDRRTGRLEVLVVQRDLSGREYNANLQTLNLNLSPSNFEDMAAHGLKYRTTVRLHPDAQSVRMVVRDMTTGIAGTLTIPTTAFAD